VTGLQLPNIDFFIVLFFLGSQLVVGLYASRRANRSYEEYLLMGRRLSLPAFIATLVATWYGGILGIGEFTYRYGILNWFAQGLPYYLFAILFALFLAPRIRESNQYTLPDQLRRQFGTPAGIIGGLFIFILTTPAPHFLMVSLLLGGIFGIPFWWAFALTSLFSALYVFFGGLRAVVITDILQFILMFTGFGLIVGILITRYGGWSFLQAHLPATHLQPVGEMGLAYLMVWFFIALWTFVDAGFYQRCYAAQSWQTARKGILISVIFWVIFDFLTTTTGLYARALLPGINPLLAFPMLGQQVLGEVSRGLFFVALLATIMSTLDSYCLLSAMSFGRDFLGLLRGGPDRRQYIKIGLVFSVLVSGILIYFLPSVVRMWYTLGSLLIPSLFVPTLAALYRMPLPRQLIIAGMGLSFLASGSWFAAGIWLGSAILPRYPWHIQPFFIGCLVWFLIFLGACVRRMLIRLFSDR